MQLAFLDIEVQNQLNANVRNYTKAYDAFLKADALYEKQNEDDALMYQLSSLVSDLISSGWIKP